MKRKITAICAASKDDVAVFVYEKKEGRLQYPVMLWATIEERNLDGELERSFVSGFIGGGESGSLDSDDLTEDDESFKYYSKLNSDIPMADE